MIVYTKVIHSVSLFFYRIYQIPKDAQTYVRRTSPFTMGEASNLPEEIGVSRIDSLRGYQRRYVWKKLKGNLGGSIERGALPIRRFPK